MAKDGNVMATTENKVHSFPCAAFAGSIPVIKIVSTNYQSIFVNKFNCCVILSFLEVFLEVAQIFTTPRFLEQRNS